ncbi:unnamed protein product [Cladocopium goreaui]|uniref:Uncharacterized protein n=1 Tax=Cladocopium goreaui TaxID=2562237 RepID=A0A9P1CMK8_9DINO|nr:unnamed protein product [Cladocopium goreaui]
MESSPGHRHHHCGDWNLQKGGRRTYRLSHHQKLIPSFNAETPPNGAAAA